jgi:hypothetical protein
MIIYVQILTTYVALKGRVVGCGCETARLFIFEYYAYCWL